jgi:hypothetical protein
LIPGYIILNLTKYAIYPSVCHPSIILYQSSVGGQGLGFPGEITYLKFKVAKINSVFFVALISSLKEAFECI